MSVAQIRVARTRESLARSTREADVARADTRVAIADAYVGVVFGATRATAISHCFPGNIKWVLCSLHSPIVHGGSANDDSNPTY